MNKKFSTLLASVLLTSAFTVNAQTPVEGDYVRLIAGGNVVGIEDGALKAQTAVTPTAPAAGKTYKDVIESVNIQLWKIAKITKSDKTGEKTYQFVNKQTGEYLAVDLVTDQKSHESSSEAKLNGAGNREWAFDNGVLYAYDAKTDSTFFLDSQLKLVSKPGKNTAGGQKIDPTLQPDLSLTLEADAYNALMALPGNSGKLHFNNSKNVSSNEENIVEGVEWTAQNLGLNQNLGLKVFALTDKSSVKGYADDMEKKDNAYVKVDKLNYLQVDTLFHNEQDGYLKLVKDTIPYELVWKSADKKYVQNNAEAKKPAARRNASNAEFSGKYYFANDSIVLTAVNRPVKLLDDFTSGGGLTYSLEDENTAYSAAVTAVNNDVLIHQTLAAKLDQVKSLYTTWAATNNADPENTSKFSGQIGVSEALAAITAMNTDNIQVVTEYVTKANAAVIAKATANPEGVFADIADMNAYNTNLAAINDNSTISGVVGATLTKLQAAYSGFKTKFENEKYVTVSKEFKDAYFTSEGTYTTETEGNTKGEDLMNAVKSNINQAWQQTSKDYVNNVVDAIGGVKYTGATIVNSTITSAGSVAIADADFNKAKEALTHTTLLSALEALNSAYATFANGTVPAAGEQAKEFTTDNQTAISNAQGANTDHALSEVTTFITNVSGAKILPQEPNATKATYYTDGKRPAQSVEQSGQLILRKLGNGMVLTITKKDESTDRTNLTDKGYTLPLIQPYATSGGDAADIVTAAKVYNLQKKDASSLRATSNTNKYLVAVKGGAPVYVDEVDASNVYAQWAFIPGVSGYYSIQNRATREVLYTGPVYKVKDADGDVVADTYVLGSDTLKIAGVTLNEDNFYTESKKQYDYSGAYYAGPGEGTSVYKTFAINPVSPFMSQLAAQFDKDSVLVLGDATEAPVWYMEKASAQTYGLEIDGLPRLKKQLYRIYTLNDDEKKLYVYATTDASPVYAVTLLGSKHVYLDEDDAVQGAAEFEFRNMAENQYQFISSELHDGQKMTINATPSKPILEVSKLTAERNDLFMINKSENSIYRTLAEDLINGNVKIYMENEPNRYLYENTANIVANNGNKIAKDSLNFLGIYNTAALTKNAAIYVDTAYVNRKDNYMPQYMFALGVEDVEAQDAIACTYEHNHFDNAGNKVDAEHCSHATPATIGYKAGRYLVSLTDSIDGVSKHPGRYDGETRLAFVNAIHRNAEDALIIKDSKYTGTKKASNDTLKIADTKLNAATFALKIADQSTQSFYMETKAAGKTQWIRILNGVPVLTTKIEDAAIFNIEATDEEATANEAIAAEGVQVIGGKGAVTVQGAAGKVITVANVLGQTIANQVAASDNVTIAVPAGIVVVAVEGEATKVVVK